MSNLVHQKVGVFIDAENVEISGYDVYGGRTNYAKLIEELGDREITRIIYYKPIHKTISDEFRKFWAGMGGEIKQPVKNADAWLAIDAVTMSEKLDVVAIIGGDKDYLPLIWYLKNRGCRVEVWSYPETASEMIKQSADLFVPMDDRFTIKDRPKGGVARRVTRRVIKPE